jgi:hypothetical protein
MRKAIGGAVGMIGVVIVAGFSAYALAAPKGLTKRAFTETVTGAQISMTGLSIEGAFKVTNSLDGKGNVQTGRAGREWQQHAHRDREMRRRHRCAQEPEVHVHLHRHP